MFSTIVRERCRSFFIVSLFFNFFLFVYVYNEFLLGELFLFLLGKTIAIAAMRVMFQVLLTL